MAGLQSKVQSPKSNLKSNPHQSCIYSNQKTTFKLFTSNTHTGKICEKIFLAGKPTFLFLVEPETMNKKN